MKILQIGNLTLRKKAIKIKDFNSPATVSLIKNLKQLVKEAEGVGISAVQIGITQRVFIMASRPNSRYPHAPRMKAIAIINPRIISKSRKTNKDWEGCLSVPGIRGLIKRHNKITVEFTNERGKVQKKVFQDFLARIFQHEYDHLEGILFTDRLENTREIISNEEYLKLIKAKA